MQCIPKSGGKGDVAVKAINRRAFDKKARATALNHILLLDAFPDNSFISLW